MEIFHLEMVVQQLVKKKLMDSIAMTVSFLRIKLDALNVLKAARLVPDQIIQIAKNVLVMLKNIP